MKMFGKTKTAHFSVDDTIWLFKGLNEEGYKSAFEQPVLSLFQTLHQKYGIIVSFYCFMQQDWMNLQDVTNAYRDELSENSDWMRFGFHARNENVHYSDLPAETAGEDYYTVTEQLRRICGNVLDECPRIHCYSAHQGSLRKMKKYGLQGVLCAEKGIESCYGLTYEQKQLVDKSGIYLDKKDGITYISTDLRIEETGCMVETIQLGKRSHLEIFTHEWALKRDHVQDKLELCAALLERMGYQGSLWEKEVRADG